MRTLNGWLPWRHHWIHWLFSFHEENDHPKTSRPEAFFSFPTNPETISQEPWTAWTARLPFGIADVQIREWGAGASIAAKLQGKWSCFWHVFEFLNKKPGYWGPCILRLHIGACLLNPVKLWENIYHYFTKLDLNMNLHYPLLQCLCRTQGIYIYHFMYPRYLHTFFQTEMQRHYANGASINGGLAGPRFSEIRAPDEV